MESRTGSMSHSGSGEADWTQSGYAPPNSPSANNNVATTNNNNNNRPNSSNSNNNISKSSNRLYRTAANRSLSVTREIAALDFLSNIPLEAEGKIVREGFHQLGRLRKEESKTEDDSASDGETSFGVPTSVQGKWWGKWIKSTRDYNDGSSLWSMSDPSTLQSPTKAVEDRDDAQLERPGADDRGMAAAEGTTSKTSVWQAYAPGRRLEGDDAIRVKIPVTTTTLTKQRSIARQAALREWEINLSNGFVNHEHKLGEKSVPTPLSNGRLFFSAAGAYPVR